VHFYQFVLACVAKCLIRKRVIVHKRDQISLAVPARTFFDGRNGSRIGLTGEFFLTAFPQLGNQNISKGAGI
jgi:hypothetical protein